VLNSKGLESAFGKCCSEMGSPHRAHRIGTPGQEDPHQLIISQRKCDPL
jgi:hypothetical protein